MRQIMREAGVTVERLEAGDRTTLALVDSAGRAEGSSIYAAVTEAGIVVRGVTGGSVFVADRLLRALGYVRPENGCVPHDAPIDLGSL